MKRTREYVLEEYDRGKWSLVFNTLKDIECGPDMVYEILDKTYANDPETSKRVRKAWFQINNVLKIRAKSATAIAEFGAGWGGQLLNLWLNEGPDVLYYGFEFTNKGIECIETICDMLPAFACIPFSFDFYEPDTWDEATDILSREISPLIFTVHAIEQIPEISKEFFIKLIEDVPHGRYVHLEPVGWQLTDERNEYAEENDYNRNLIDVLLELEDEGKIEIEAIVRDTLSYSLRNKATYIEWVPK